MSRSARVCVSLSQYQTVSVKVSVCAGVSLSQCQIVGVFARVVLECLLVLSRQDEPWYMCVMKDCVMKDCQVKQQGRDTQPLTLWHGESLDTHTPSMCRHTHTMRVYTHIHGASV